MGFLFKEKRSHPSRPENWLLYGLTGTTRSHAGVDVTEEGSLSSMAVWSAITQLSQDIATTPCHYYKRLEKGKKRLVDDPLYDIVHLKPNPEMDTVSYTLFIVCWQHDTNLVSSVSNDIRWHIFE